MSAKSWVAQSNWYPVRHQAVQHREQEAREDGGRGPEEIGRFAEVFAATLGHCDKSGWYTWLQPEPPSVRRRLRGLRRCDTRPASATGSNRNLMRQQEVTAPPTNTTKTSTEPVTNTGPTIGLGELAVSAEPQSDWYSCTNPTCATPPGVCAACAVWSVCTEKKIPGLPRVGSRESGGLPGIVGRGCPARHLSPQGPPRIVSFAYPGGIRGSKFQFLRFQVAKEPETWNLKPETRFPMPREPILSAGPDRDEEFDRGLRPQRIKEMVGQRDVIERLNIVVDAARKRGEPLGHILFDGPPGLGKTTFANCIPRELNVPLVTASGPAIKAPKDLMPFLTNMEERAVFFIDEIHRLPKAVEEYLYTAMEDFRLDIILGDGVNARTINMRIKPFTLIGATTRAGMLSAAAPRPLRDPRALGFYSLPELTEIVRRSAQEAERAICTTTPPIEIARRSRDTPRIANNRLRWVRDYADSQAGGEVTLRRGPGRPGDGRHRRARPRQAGPRIPGNDHPRLRRRPRRASKRSPTR